MVGDMTQRATRDPELIVNELEQLAAQNPDRYTHRLAWALGSWGDRLWDEARQDEYLLAYEHAAHVVRVRVEAGTATEQEANDLPQHVGNVASVAYRIGRLEIARQAAEEAILRESSLAGVPRPERWDSKAFLARMTALLADASSTLASAPNQTPTTTPARNQGSRLT